YARTLSAGNRPSMWVMDISTIQTARISFARLVLLLVSVRLHLTRLHHMAQLAANSAQMAVFIPSTRPLECRLRATARAALRWFKDLAQAGKVDSRRGNPRISRMPRARRVRLVHWMSSATH